MITYKDIERMTENTTQWRKKHMKLLSHENKVFFWTYKLQHILLDGDLIWIKLFNSREASNRKMVYSEACYDMEANYISNIEYYDK